MTIAEFKDCIRPYATEILHRLEMREMLASWVCMEPPFGIDEYLNCIAFECIYRTYYMNAPKKSIRWHILNDGEEYDDIARLLAQRTMKRVRDNRDERLGQLYNRYGLEPEELLRQYSFHSMEERKIGYKLNEAQFRQKTNWERLKILKKIDTRQICDTRHYPNERRDKNDERSSLKGDIKEYERHFEAVFSSASTSEEYILASIELFEVERYFFIEFAYALSVAMAKMKEIGCSVMIPTEAIYLLCNAAHSSTGIKTDSRFIVGRLGLIPAICNGRDWDILKSKIMCFLRGKIALFHNITIGDTGESLIQFFSRNVDIGEQARFISDDYKIQSIIHTTKVENWSNIQIQYFREIYRSVIRDEEKRQKNIATGASRRGYN